MYCSNKRRNKLFIIKFQQTENKQTMYEIEIINKQNDSIRQQQSIDCDKALKNVIMKKIVLF